MELSQYIPLITGTILEAILLIVIGKNRIYRRFPVFSAYILLDFLRTLIIPAIALRHPTSYFYAYWLSIPIEYTITLLIILEVFAYIFGAYIRQSPRVLKIFAGITLLLLVISVLAIVVPDAPTKTTNGFILAADRGVQLLICGLLIFMWVYSRNLGLQWRHHVWGIVFGLGIYSGANLFAAAIHASTGEMCLNWITPLPHVVYQATLAIWIGYFLRTEPARAPFTIEELTAYQNLITSCQAIIADIRKVIR